MARASPVTELQAHVLAMWSMWSMWSECFGSSGKWKTDDANAHTKNQARRNSPWAYAYPLGMDIWTDGSPTSKNMCRPSRENVRTRHVGVHLGVGTRPTERDGYAPVRNVMPTISCSGPQISLIMALDTPTRPFNTPSRNLASKRQAKGK